MGLVPSIISVLLPVPVPGVGCRRQGWLGSAGRGTCSTAPALPLPWGHPSHPLSPSGRSLDRLDSVEILLPPKFPTWEEEYNQISDSVNESGCINQVSCWSTEPHCTGTPQ